VSSQLVVVIVVQAFHRRLLDRPVQSFHLTAIRENSPQGSFRVFMAPGMLDPGLDLHRFRSGQVLVLSGFLFESRVACKPFCPAHCLARNIPQDCVVASLEMFSEQFVLGVKHEADQHGHER
jgi:hypothetical protein